MEKPGCPRGPGKEMQNNHFPFRLCVKPEWEWKASKSVHGGGMGMSQIQGVMPRAPAESDSSCKEGDKFYSNEICKSRALKAENLERSPLI